MPSEPLNGGGKVEIDTVFQWADALASIDHALCRARRYVARSKVAEARIDPFQVVVAFVFWDVSGGPCFVGFLGNPDSAVIAERLGHEGELRLEVVGLGYASRVDLCIGRVGEGRPATVRAPRSGDVASHGIGGEVEHVAIPASGKHHCMRGVRRELTGHQVAADDSGATIFDVDDVDHFHAVPELDIAKPDLACELLVGANQQLLACLTAGVEGAAYLSATETAIVEQTPVVTSERDTLSHHLIDDVD